MEFIILLAVGVGIGLIFSWLTRSKEHGRDAAAQNRDRALARLYEAKANQTQIENDRTREELRQAANRRRQQACDEVRDA